MRFLSLGRQRPDAALAAVKQAGLDEIKPGPGHLVLELGLPSLVQVLDLLRGDVSVLFDPGENLGRARLAAKRSQGIQNRREILHKARTAAGGCRCLILNPERLGRILGPGKDLLLLIADERLGIVDRNADHPGRTQKSLPRRPLDPAALAILLGDDDCAQ
jgi:hypothetical protein